MLMVTTTVRMLNRVHGNTSNSWPVVSLSLGLEPGVGSLQQWLIGSLSAGNHTNHSSAVSEDGLSGSGWKLDPSLLSIIEVTDDDGGGTGGSGERSSVSEFGLTVGDNSAFWQGVHGDNISNSELGY